MAVVHNESVVVLTRSLASQCGFSSNIDASGTLRIYASLLNCFSENQNDRQFSVELILKLSPDEVYTVTETCEYEDWAPREVLCQKNYMEVSLQRILPDDQLLPKSSFYGAKSVDHRRAAQTKQEELSFPSTTVRFLSQSDEQRDMDVSTALSRGYSLSLTHSRLVLRSPLSTTETYVQQVSGVPMTVLRTSTLFGRKWLSSQIYAAAACPLLAGSVSFSDASIRWFLPKRITPLLSSGQLTLLDVGLGVDGRRLEAAELKARRYSLMEDETYIVVDIPIGAKGGYYKSAVQNGRYLTCYRVEPTLELLWTEDVSNEDTRYRVLFPITTPYIYNSLQVTQNTKPKEDVLRLSIGPFAPDVMLFNISWSSETLTLGKALSRGFKVQEQLDQDSIWKSFTVSVPLTDQAVQQMKDQGHTVYSAQLTFGFMVVPELQTFLISAVLEARLMDTVPPSVTGVCDDQNFHVLVRSGTWPFRVLVGRSPLTPTLAKQYSFVDNGTHFTLTVPILAPDVTYENIESSMVRARVDVTLISPEDYKHITDYSLSCNFFSTLIECFPNGTITVLALKLEAVPGLDPGQLTLADPLCGPVFSTERFAFFSFTGSSCGTIRKFVGNTMVYENDVALPDDQLAQRLAQNKEPEYHLKVKCLYDTNTTHGLSYHLQQSMSKPVAETSRGQLHMLMRMAHDASFGDFYTDEDFPLSVSQHEALWFEVELRPELGGEVSVELEKCWATEDQDKTSTPRWSFISNGCVVQDSPFQVHMVPVQKDFRVHFPSQLKRFTLHLGSLIQQQGSFQLFVHCDGIICDPRNPLGGVCAGQCSARPRGLALSTEEHVYSGPILLT